MFELYGEKTAQEVQGHGIRFVCRIDEQEDTEEYDSNELQRILAESEPPRGEP